MKTRPVLAAAGLSVLLAGAAVPALAAGSPKAACPTAAAGTTSTFAGVVVRPENPSAAAAKPTSTPSAKPSATATVTTAPSATRTATATATTSPKAKPAAVPTLQVKVLRGTRSMAGKTYTVVDCAAKGAAARKDDRVTVTAYRVRGDSHRLYASNITVTKAAAKPTSSATPTSTATASSTPKATSSATPTSTAKPKGRR